MKDNSNSNLLRKRLNLYKEYKRIEYLNEKMEGYGINIETTNKKNKEQRKNNDNQSYCFYSFKYRAKEG